MTAVFDGSFLTERKRSEVAYRANNTGLGVCSPKPAKYLVVRYGHKMTNPSTLIHELVVLPDYDLPFMHLADTPQSETELGFQCFMCKLRPHFICTSWDKIQAHSYAIFEMDFISLPTSR
ncbi:hypothetical protein AVEN_93995-1 [Araneus ventricosus]|uniref:Uncharacterized protein n=1 Tax=Araneus ventricosus TaxID=182803 RepID=A0A4Y2CLI8_ARAVE|nr:hypothetical protein AVEN_93995-1 [Araneus ventricosus]